MTSAVQLTSALSQAGSSAEADTIELRAGTYAGQFSYTGLSDLTVTGAGPTLTTIANGTSATTAVHVSTTANVTLEQLGVSLTGGNGTVAFSLDGAHVVAQDVRVVAQPAATNTTGVQPFDGAGLRRATLSGALARAVLALGGAASIDSVTISGADVGLASEAPGATLTATHVVASDVGSAGDASFSGTLVVTDSLLRMRPVGTSAFFSYDANNPATHASHLVLARDTIVAGGSNQRGVSVQADRNDGMTAVVTDTILSGFTTPLQCFAVNGGSATLTTTNLAQPSGTNDLSGCAPAAVRQTNTIVATPHFRAVGSGDYRLAPDSPLIDVSDAVPAGATDLDGRPRPSDGTGDCVRRGDVGAYELLLAPVASAAASPGAAETGTPVTFTGTACDSGSASPVAAHWTFDDGGSADGLVVSHAFATAGAHVATLTVRDAQGQTTTAQASVTVVPPVPPSILRFAAPRGGFTLGRGLPLPGGRAGRSLTVELSEPATVTLSATRLVPGRLRNGRCGAPRRAPRGRRCTRRLSVRATASLALPAGTSLVAFAGRLASRAPLQPGRWELRLVAQDATGLSSAAARLVVTIHRPPSPPRRPRRRR